MRRLKRSIYLGLSLVGLMAFSGCGGNAVEQTQGASVQDEKGTTEEQRIVALSVSLVDILAELGVEMVGVPNSQYSLNEKVADVTKVGLPMSPDIEIIASLNPTHVLSLTTLESMVSEKLGTVGIQGTYLNAENIDTLKASIATIGEMFDREAEAVELIANFEADINATIESVKGKTSPKVLILFGFPGNYLAGTSASFVGQMVEMLGGTNVVADSNTAYANVNLEALLVSEPDIILRMTHGVKEEVLEMFEKEFNENPIWSQFDAVKNGNVYDLDDSLFNVSASLETAKALSELAEIIY